MPAPSLFARAAPLTTLLLACCFAAHGLSALSVALQFDRDAIAGGQLWRVATGHLTHWNGEHFFWDAVIFAPMGWLAESQSRRRYFVCLLGALLAIGAALWFLRPDVQAYRGLSGLDTALFAMLGSRLLVEKLRARQWGWVCGATILLAALAAKLAYECLTGGLLFVDPRAAGFMPIPLAHIAGAAIGIAVGLAPFEGCLRLRRRGTVLEASPVQMLG